MITPAPTWYTNGYIETQVGVVCLERGWRMQLQREWYIGYKAAADFETKPTWDILGGLMEEDSNTSTWLVAFSGGGAKLHFSRGKVWTTTYGDTLEICKTVQAELVEALPRALLPEEGIKLTFWSLTSNGPVDVERELTVTEWPKIEHNYPSASQGALQEIMQRTPQSDEGGKLILWHGPPGTGKTWAIRALARQWKDWASFHYITDPEDFFTQSAAYMMKVILDDELGSERWKVLVLEDSGELLAVDAKERSGQGLSRLLNLCDGLIGQGLRLLVLITTNENLASLHPAVTRPGRCLANVEFGEFTATESEDWLKRRDVPREEIAYRERTLAQLYEEVAEHEQIRSRRAVRRIGFQVES